MRNDDEEIYDDLPDLPGPDNDTFRYIAGFLAMAAVSVEVERET